MIKCHRLSQSVNEQSKVMDSNTGNTATPRKTPTSNSLSPPLPEESPGSPISPTSGLTPGQKKRLQRKRAAERRKSELLSSLGASPVKELDLDSEKKSGEGIGIILASQVTVEI